MPETPLNASLIVRLTAWFQRQKRVLPWREEPRDPYRVWLSEMMLQQTQVVTVIPYFHRFLELFPKVEDLARASEESVMKAWAGLGYYSRARNLQKGARHIVARGKFPENLEAWLEVPGVGPYTAGAVCSLALGQYVPLVDGNVERVFSRLFLLSREKLGERAYRDKMWELATGAVRVAEMKKVSAGALNEGWMELGATVCTPRNPLCTICPLAKDCGAYEKKATDRYPEKKPKPKKVQVFEKVIALLDVDARKILLEDSTRKKWRKGLWDLPEEIFGMDFASDVFPELETAQVLRTKHVVTNHQISRETFVLKLSELSPNLRKKVLARMKVPGESVAWVSLRDPERPLGSPSKKILQLLEERFF